VSGLVLSIVLLLPVGALAQIPQLPCAEGTLPSGAKSMICVPPGWNQQNLVVYAPGYAAPGPELTFHDLVLGGMDLRVLVLSQGYAFATTSYRQNGLAILEGVDDIRELVTAFTVTVAPPQRTFMTGGSEGGLVAALLLEQSPEKFTSGLAACGPVGTFRGQVNYIGDFRALFDYFFPEVIPGSAIDVPVDVVQNWFTIHLPAALQALKANLPRALELMRTSKAAYDPANLDTIAETASQVLTYHMISTTDAAVKLGGNPYGNQFKWYLGSSNDLRLNLRVERFAAQATAVAEMKKYETTGNLTKRLVTLHTTADGLVPFAHEPIYLAKVLLTGHSGLLPLPVNGYGHCTFDLNDLQTALGLMVQ
jgi:pimeloyl-ACP methyl ester carboxylesterase